MQRDWDRKAAFLVITVGCGDADTSLGMSGEGVLPVGEQQFLIASAVKLRIFRVDAGQLCDQVRKITVLCFALFQGDAGTQGCIAFAASVACPVGFTTCISSPAFSSFIMPGAMDLPW